MPCRPADETNRHPTSTPAEDETIKPLPKPLPLALPRRPQSCPQFTARLPLEF